MTEIIVIASLLLVFAVAMTGRKRLSQSQYWTNERETPWWTIAASVSSSTVGAGTLFGVATAGYIGGNAGAVIGIANSIGIILFGLFISPKIFETAKVNNFYSLGDFLENIIGSKISRLAGVILFVAYFFFTAAQFAALSFIVQFITKLDYFLSVGIAALSIFAYSMVGGIRADMRTDVVQLAFMTIFVPVIFIHIFWQGDNLVQSYLDLPIGYITGEAYQGWTFLIAAILLIPLSVIPSVDLWQRTFAAKSLDQAKKGFIFGGILMMILFTSFSLVGTFSFIIDPSLDPSTALMAITESVSSPIVLGILASGLIAAILSTADTMLLASSISLSKDVLGRSDFSAQRLTVAIICISCIVAAVAVPDVINLVVKAFSVILILLPAVLGIFMHWWRNEPALIVSVVAGGVVALAVMFVDPLMAFVPGTFTSLIVYVVARRFV